MLAEVWFYESILSIQIKIHFPNLVPLLSEKNHLNKFVQMATSTAWSMVTLQPPMIAMCPSATVANLDLTIHEKREFAWDKHVTGDVPLVYQRPILYTTFATSQPEVQALVIHETPKRQQDHETTMSTHTTCRVMSQAGGAMFIGGDKNETKASVDNYEEDPDEFEDL